MICELIHRIFGKRRHQESIQNDIVFERDTHKNDWLTKKIKDYSLSVLLGKSRAVNIIGIHCSDSKSDAILNFDDAELFFKGKFGKKIVYSNSYIPYHFLITKNGEILETMPLSAPAISLKGHLNDGIAICYVGGVDDYGAKSDVIADEQKESILWLVSALKSNLGINTVFGIDIIMK